jgi:chromosome segregation ATPase
MAQASITKHDVRAARHALQAAGIPEPGILRIRTQLGGKGSTQLITRFRDELREEETAQRAEHDAEALKDQRLARSPLPASALQGLTQAWLELLDARDQDRLALEDHLDHQLAEHEAQREISEAAIVTLQQAYDELTGQAAALKGERDTLHETLEQTKQTHVQTLNERDRALSEKDKALAETTASLAEVRGQVELLSTNLAEQNRLAERREAARVEELETLNEKLEARDRQMQALRTEHQTHVAALNSEWQRKLIEVESKLNRQQEQLASTTHALEDARKEKTDIKTRATQLEKANVSLMKRLESSQLRNDALQEQLGALTSQLAEQTAQLNRLLSSKVAVKDSNSRPPGS